MTEYTSISDRVAKGVEWLDANISDWVDRIVLRDLDLRSPCKCVLGFCYADAVVGETKNGYTVGEDIINNEGLDASDLGFDIIDNMSEYDLLQYEWTRVITERKQ